jgi:SSU ribosomal protein S8P
LKGGNNYDDRSNRRYANENQKCKQCKARFSRYTSVKNKKEIARILLDEGFIKGFDVIDDGKQGIIRVDLKYGKNGEKTISGIKRISKPGLKVYAKSEELPRVLGGLGIAIVSTSKGIMTDRQARKENVGGEVICYIW